MNRISVYMVIYVAALYLLPICCAELDLAPWLSLYVDRGENKYFGYCVSFVGDLNGDGFEDFAIGNDLRTKYTYVDVVFGGSTKIELEYLELSDEGYGEHSAFGKSLAGLGDINGDGYDDLAVGAYNSPLNHWGGVGRVFIFFGGCEMDSTPDLLIDGRIYAQGLGFSLAGLGDINGDGFPDLIAGAPFEERTIPGQGFAYIYFGGPDMDGIADIELAGELIFLGEFGWSASGAGDVNGDGYNDVIVGAKLAYNVGRAYLYFGGPEVDAIPDLIFSGSGEDFYLGESVAGAGDLNGDGYDDVLVGSPRTHGHNGRVYILFGGSPMDAAADLIIDAESQDDMLGSSVASAGDLNGDGYDDAVIGAEIYGPGAGIGAGKVYVFFGGNPMDGVCDASLFHVPRGDLGSSVSGGGDVNGDGLDDFIAGAGIAEDHGRAYLVLGDTFRPSILLAGSVSVDLGAGRRRLLLTAVPSTYAGAPNTARIDVLYDSALTGLWLHDDGLVGDLIAGDGVFSHACEFAFDPDDRGDYLVELTAVDWTGQASDTWPYVEVHPTKSPSAVDHSSFSLPLLKPTCDRIVQSLDVAGSTSPHILFWGTGRSFLKEDRGGGVEIVCIAYDLDGLDDIARIELYYQGIPTGVNLDYVAEFTDLLPLGGAFTAYLTTKSTAPEGLYLLEARAFDKQGNESDFAPYVHLE